jgi:hypothetical protein
LLLSLTYYATPIVGGLMWIMIVNAVEIILYRRNKLLEVINYANRFDHIYVVTRHPDGRQHTLPIAIDEVTVWAAYQDIQTTIQQEKKKLNQAENPWLTEPPHAQRIQVIPIIYREGRHVTETWDMFQDRIIYEIKESRETRHENIKLKSIDWYYKNALNNLN